MSSVNDSLLNPHLLEMYVGTMYSGKSKALIERALEAKKRGIPTFIFKPLVDTRSVDLMSKAGMRVECMNLSRSTDILLDENLKKETNALVLIDELHFFDGLIIYVVQYLIHIGHNVVVACLDRDFRGQPFNDTAYLMVLADKVTTLYSRCSIEGCKNPGSLTQRLRNGKPDSLLTKTIEIEFVAEVEYQPVCREHHRIPDFEDFIRQKVGIEF
ncbi:MAG: thymidine kinase [Candidatus Heimdallarchaeota archaeon]|nr:MAG: thymidine kinase [Candidatus Heimdallarchaeota archaeon]